MQTTFHILLGVLLALFLAIVSTMPIRADQEMDKNAVSIYLDMHKHCKAWALSAQDSGHFKHPGGVLFLECMSQSYQATHKRVVEMWEEENSI